MPDEQLLKLFSDDIGHAKRLLELIETEFSALEQRDLQRLQELLAEKQPLLALLDQHAAQRSALLKGCGLSPDRAGLEKLATQSIHGARLHDESESLADLLERCQNANLRNGRIIKANQNAVGQLLGIIRGQETPNLYDRRGSTARGGYNRPLSQA